MKNSNELLAAILAAAMLDGEQETKTEETDFRKKAEDIGNALYQSYLGFKDAGFTDEQAFQIVLMIGGRK